MDVKTAARILELFNLFADQQKPLIYSEIANRMGIPLSSCHALLKTMVAKGYLYELGKKMGYYPTQKLLHVATVICRRDPLVALVEPILLNLRDLSRETAILAKLADTRVVYLSVVESNETIRYSHQPGGFKALHATSTGKALLSALPPEEVDALLASYTEWAAITSNTLTKPQDLLQEIAAGRERGWQRSVGENVDDVMSLAYGFRVHDQPFALVVAGPLNRVLKNEQTLAKVLLDSKPALAAAFSPTPIQFDWERPDE